jgi:hypothetical protein
MKIKPLFVVAAVLEASAGVALAAWPAAVVALVFGSPLSTDVGVAIGRIAGVALLSLGVACWLSRNDEHSRAATGLIRALLLYNGAAVAVLAHAGMVSGLLGVALWPGLILHVALVLWCIASLRMSR